MPGVRLLPDNNNTDNSAMRHRTKQVKVDLSTLEQEYKSLSALAENFCFEITSQLTQLLRDEAITLGFPIQYRVKEWESLTEKLDRLSLEISSIKDVQDFVGLRLILLFNRDVDKVCSLLSGKFKVIRQYDTQERLAEDQFGYSSIHFIVELPEEWLAVPTLSRFGGLCAEIQVRTVAQHIWAAASHTLQYKQEATIPPSVRRAIYRVSALLETVDLEFERVLEQRDTYRASVDTSNRVDQLNVDLLEKTLDGLLPGANKKPDEQYADLLKDLFHFDIRTPAELKRIVEKHLQGVLAMEASRLKQLQKKLETGQRVLNPERLQQGVHYSHVGLARYAMILEFGDTWTQYRQQERKLRIRKETEAK